jgi:hypothetical protein
VKRWPLTTGVALLWVAAICAAQAPDEPPRLATSSAAVVTFPGQPAGKLRWLVHPEAKKLESGQTVVILGPPGEYTVTGVDDGSILQTTVLFGGPGPAPLIPPASPAVQPAVTAGRLYRPAMAAAYSSAWLAGADAIDAGKPMAAALEVVASTWRKGRSDLFAKSIEPLLSAIIPGATADADVTPAQRTRLAAAFRDVAKGLVSP